MASWIGTGASDPGDVATNGAIGVGTASPRGKIESVGDGAVSANNDNLIIAGGATFPYGQTILWKPSMAEPTWRLAEISGIRRSGGYIGALTFSVNTANTLSGTTEIMRIDYTGNVGVNQTNPQEKLDVSGNIKGSGALIIPAIKPASDSTTALQLQTSGGTNILNVDTTNLRIGVGTLSPSDKFEVYSGNIALRTADNYPQLQLFNYDHNNVSINFDSYYNSGWKSSNAGSNFRIYKMSDKLRISYASGVGAGSTISDWSSEDNNCALVIDKYGKTGLGTTSPESKLEILPTYASSWENNNTGRPGENTPPDNLYILAGSSGAGKTTDEAVIKAQTHASIPTTNGTGYRYSYDLESVLNADHYTKYIGLRHFLRDKNPGSATNGDHVSIQSNISIESNRDGNDSGWDEWLYWGVVGNNGYHGNGCGMELDLINTDTDYLDNDPSVGANPQEHCMGGVQIWPEYSTAHVTRGFMTGQGHNGAGFSTGMSLCGFVDTGIYLHSDIVYQNLKTQTGTPLKVAIRFSDALTNLLWIQRSHSGSRQDYWALNAASDRSYLTWQYDISNTPKDLLVLADSGKIGIGTASPSSALTVDATTSSGLSGSGDLDMACIQARNNYTAYNSNPKAGLLFVTRYGDTALAALGGIQAGKENTTNGDYAGYLSLYTRQNGSLVTERIRISSYGSVGINTPSPSQMLDVNGNIKASGSIEAGGHVTVGGSSGPQILSGTGNPGGSAPQGSMYIKTNATGTTDRLWIYTGAAWAYLTTNI